MFVATASLPSFGSKNSIIIDTVLIFCFSSKDPEDDLSSEEEPTLKKQKTLPSAPIIEIPPAVPIIEIPPAEGPENVRVQVFVSDDALSHFNSVTQRVALTKTGISQHQGANFLWNQLSVLEMLAFVFLSGKYSRFNLNTRIRM